MKSGEFDKKLHPEVLATAEEVAVSYETLMRARGEVSPGMERAQSAARAGLEEVVLVLAECSQPTPGMPPIVDVLQAAKVTIFGQPASRPLTSRETAALGRIGKLARDLGALAAEAAQFSLEPAGSPDAALQVREALGALRLEREARDELERELRQNRG